MMVRSVSFEPRRVVWRDRKARGLMLMLACWGVSCGDEERLSGSSQPSDLSTGDSAIDDDSTVAPVVDPTGDALLEDLVLDAVTDGTEVCVAAESASLGVQFERNCVDTSMVAAEFAGGVGTGRTDFPGLWIFAVAPDADVIEVTRNGINLPSRRTQGAIAVLSPILGNNSDHLTVVLNDALSDSSCEFDGAFLVCKRTL